MNKVLTLLERLPLRRKLILGFSALLVLTLILGAQSLRTQERLKREMQQLYQQDLAGIDHPVSYTHLDVYKRQPRSAGCASRPPRPPVYARNCC